MNQSLNLVLISDQTSWLKYQPLDLVPIVDEAPNIEDCPPPNRQGCRSAAGHDAGACRTHFLKEKKSGTPGRRQCHSAFGPAPGVRIAGADALPDVSQRRDDHRLRSDRERPQVGHPSPLLTDRGVQDPSEARGGEGGGRVGAVRSLRCVFCGRGWRRRRKTQGSDHNGSRVGTSRDMRPLPAVAGRKAGVPLSAVAEGNGFNHMGRDGRLPGIRALGTGPPEPRQGPGARCRDSPLPPRGVPRFNGY